MELEQIHNSIDKLNTYHLKLAEDMGKIHQSLDNILLEAKRTNGRIKDLEAERNRSKPKIRTMEEEISYIKKKIDTLRPVLFFVEYPKLTVLILAGLYLFSIKEVRDALLGVMGVF